MLNTSAQFHHNFFVLFSNVLHINEQTQEHNRLVGVNEIPIGAYWGTTCCQNMLSYIRM